MASFLQAGEAEVREVARLDVRAALAEDIGAGDLSAALADADARARGVLTCRDDGVVLCGTEWFAECFRALDAGAKVDWRFAEGDEIGAGFEVAVVSGLSRALLSAERSALNFLQTLSATATAARRLSVLVGGKGGREGGREGGSGRVKLVDTRKTLPKLRFAQKHAVRVGGAWNHRAGLFDEILLKENHMMALGVGVGGAVRRALASGVAASRIQVEVRSLEELGLALEAGAVRILLDNFSLEEMGRAVELVGGRAELEASGGADAENLSAIAATGVDRISCGALTKHVKAADFSFVLAG